MQTNWGYLFAAVWLVHCSPSAEEVGETAAHTGVAALEEPLENEAGFVTVPPQTGGASYSARMFYAFHPADEAPASKPLFVLFNGGPGFATTSGLMAYGTAPTTLVDGAPEDASPAPNPASLTRFANLLYVDERVTGFSYALRDADGGAPRFDCRFSPVGDAGDFATVVLSFMDAHPAIRNAPVVLMGESYGGTRAVALLRILQRSDDPTLPISDALRTAVAEHFATGGAAPGPDEVTRQFGGMVLIQPLVAGWTQVEAEIALVSSDAYVGPRLGKDEYDPYNLDRPAGWAGALSARAGRALADPGDGRALLGVDLASVAEALPPAREDAFRPPLTTTEVSSAKDNTAASARIAARLGALGPDDYYLGTLVQSCSDTSRVFAGDGVRDWFLGDLARVKVFVTNARWDGVIYSPAIPHVIEKAGLPTTVDTQPRPGYARPGWIQITLPAADGRPARPVEIRYPSYEKSGHMVATSQGPDLADDVEQWLQAL